MARGFECGDGWFEVVDWLSAKIEAYAKLLPDQREQFCPEVIQVKEKFGGLRFYLQYSDQTTDGWITEAEQRASRTCELCGQLGELQELPRRQTLCDAHAGKTRSPRIDSNREG